MLNIRAFHKLCTVILVLTCLTAVALAAPAPAISPDVEDDFARIMVNAKVTQGLEFIKNDHAATMADQKAIVAIPAPPFNEKTRGEYFLKRLQALGLSKVKMDAEGNVYGVRPGSGKGPVLLVEAHLDTVFPAGTNTNPVERDGKIFAPGIADDSRGLAAVLSVIRAMNASAVKTVGDIIFCGTVGGRRIGRLAGNEGFLPRTPGGCRGGGCGWNECFAHHLPGDRQPPLRDQL